MKLLNRIGASLLVGAASLIGSHGLQAMSISRQSAPRFYIDVDPNPKLECAYVAYAVTNNDGVDYANVWVSIGSFTGGIVALASGESGLYQLGPLGDGQTKTAFFYLRASGVTAVSQGHTVSVYLSKPPAAVQASAVFSLSSVEDTGQNNSNKVTTVYSQPNPPALGGVVSMSVSGTTGNIGAAEVVNFSPATFSNWPASSFQLFQVDTQFQSPNATSLQNYLYLPGPLTSSSDTAYSVTYYFRALQAVTSSAQASPVGFFSSGANVAHLDTGDWASANMQAISSISNYLLMTATASSNSVVYPNTVTFRIYVTNTGFLDVSLSDIQVNLPASPGQPTLVPNSSNWDGAVLPDGVVNGQNLDWYGDFFVPSFTTLIFEYQLSFPAAAGIYSIQSRGFVGNAQIDTSLDTANNSPISQFITLTLPTATISPTRTATPTQTATGTRTATQSPSATTSPTHSESPTFSVSPTISETHTISPTHSHSPTLTASGTITPTGTSSLTPSVTPSATQTATRTATSTRTATRTISPTRSYSSTATPTIVGTATRTASPSATPSVTPSATRTATGTRTASPTASDTPTTTPSFSASPTSSDSPTPSDTPTITETFTASPSFTVTPTFSASPTASATLTLSPTPIAAPALLPPRPNPFRPLKGQQLTLMFQVAVTGPVKIKVYNLAAELVRSLADAVFSNGSYTLTWDGLNTQGDPVASGVYVLMMEGATGQQRQLVAVIK